MHQHVLQAMRALCTRRYSRINYYMLRLIVIVILSLLALSCNASAMGLFDCPYGATSLSQCNMTDYIIAVIIFAAPGMIMFVVLWVSCPFYCCAKYCCDCCGGSKQTPNCCCPDKRYPARYSKGDLLRPRVLGIVAMLTTIGAIGWGSSGLSSLMSGLNAMNSGFLSIPNVLQNQVNLLENALIITTYDATTGAMVTTDLFLSSGLQNATLSVKTQLQQDVDSTAQTFESYIGYFSDALIVLFVTPAALILIGQIASFCSFRKFFPMTVVWGLFIFGGLLWLGYGTFSAMSMLVGDACAQITGISNQQVTIIPGLVGCTDSLFDNFRSEFQGLVQSQATSTCNTLLNHCYDSTQTADQNMVNGNILNCTTVSSSVNCSSVSFGTLYNMIKTQVTIASQIATVPNAVSGGYYCYSATSCYILDCTTQCLLGGSSGTYRGPSGNISLELYTSFTAANQVTNALDTIGAQYSNCNSIIGLLLGPLVVPCSPVTTGFQAVREASGIEGIGVLIGLFVFIWGAKRFIPFAEAEKPQMDGRDDKMQTKTT